MSGEASIWRTLAIPPTSDASAIRRAYAARLKITQPEDDPEGFKTLRAAYEMALRLARPSSSTNNGGDAPRPVSVAARPAPEPLVPAQPDLELEELRASFQELAAVLRDNGEAAHAPQALATLLQCRALQNVDFEREAEQRLAHLLASTLPRSDPLLMESARRFGWLDRQVGMGGSAAVAAILARLNDLAFLQSLQSAESPHARAFKGLQRRKLPVWSWIEAHLPRKGQVTEYQLLHLLRVEHAGLLSALNPQAVQWWDRLASRPQPSANLILVGVLLSVVFALIGWLSESGLGAGLGIAELFSAVVVWKLFLLDWPRHWIRRKWPVQAPAWIFGGWMPLAILSLAVSLVTAGWVPYAMALCGFAAVQWALIARGVAAQSGAPRVTQEFLMAVFVPQIALSFWWVGCIEHFPAGAVERMFAPFFSLMLASALGAPALRMLWLDALSPPQRTKSLAALVLLSLVVCVVLWTLSANIQWRPACAALVLTTIVLYRPFALHLSDAQQKLRVVFIVALMAAVVVASLSWKSAFESRGVMLAGGGLLLIATSMFSLALALRDTSPVANAG